MAIIGTMKAGIRELKDNLSHYIRRIEAGERVLVTAHGRVVAELVPSAGDRSRATDFERLVAAGGAPARRRPQDATVSADGGDQRFGSHQVRPPP